VQGLIGLAQSGGKSDFGGRVRGPKVRRGDVRTAIIDVLHRARTADEPINGYQVIQQIAELSNGEWRPSPGSVYPTIQQLEDEGLVEADDERGRRTLRLTEEGRRYVEERAVEMAETWAPFGEQRQANGDEYANLKPEIGQVMAAVWQIVTTGTDRQRRDAINILIETRRKLYGLLADGPEGPDGPADPMVAGEEDEYDGADADGSER
jgi:DNA-binding PadR family transcriptional regulator